MNHCFDCGEPLTLEEIEDGEVRCISCEETLCIRIQDWKLGKKDLQLDVMFYSEGSIH